MPSDRGTYRGIYSSLPDDPDFQLLSPQARHCLLTMRVMRDVGIACIWRYYPGPLSARTGYTEEEVERCLCELETALDVYGEPARWIIRESPVIWIRNGLRWDPMVTLSHKKHRDGVIRAVSELPHLQIVLSFCEYYDLPKPFERPPNGFRKGLDRVSPPIPIPIPIPIQNPAQESLSKGFPKSEPAGGAFGDFSYKPDKQNPVAKCNIVSHRSAQPTPSGPTTGEETESTLSEAGAPDDPSAQPPRSGKEADASAMRRPGPPKALKLVLTDEQAVRAKRLCAAIESLPPKARPFHPWVFLQKCVIQGLPADEAMLMLVRIRDHWPQITSVWAYAQEVLRKEYAQYRIDLALQEHERVKREPTQIGQIMRRLSQQSGDPAT